MPNLVFKMPKMVLKFYEMDLKSKFKTADQNSLQANASLRPCTTPPASWTSLTHPSTTESTRKTSPDVYWIRMLDSGNPFQSIFGDFISSNIKKALIQYFS